ncbi:MAG: maltose alpha-D-glucosyltransferase, partial [Spirochaetaceae bacterium]
PSPWRDDGYDISDYRDVHSAYGTLRDFKRFLREAHERELRVITELVINHTSNQHPWFERARNAPAGSKWRDYYMWSDTPDKYTEARIIFQDFETSNWSWDPVAKAYYWHRFYSHQPDLNFDSPHVQTEVFRLLDFWFGLGVDGLRLDAIPYLFARDDTNCENLPETHAFLKKVRSYVDEHHPGRMLLAEANQWPEDAVDYFGQGLGDECHMSFHFPLMPRLFMAMKMEDSFPVIDILEQTPEIPETSQWGIFLRNHDELTLEMVTDEERDYMYRSYGRDPRHRINLGIRRRLAPLLDNNRRGIELLNSLLFSLPGTPVIYYGDEIGMGDNVYLGDRDGVRTPMQWSSDKNAGFSGSNPQQLYLPVIIDPEYHHEAINVETQQANGSSLLWWMKRIIATRRRFAAFSRGRLEIVHSGNHRVFAFIRHHREEAILVVVNFSRHTQVAALQLDRFAGYQPEEVFSQNRFPPIREDAYVLTIGSNDYYWLRLNPGSEDVSEGGDTLTITQRDWETCGGALRTALEKRFLPAYLQHSRWFREKERTIRKLVLEDTFSVGRKNADGWVLVIRLQFADDYTALYLVPLGLAVGDEASTLRDEHPASVIAEVSYGRDEAILFDGTYNAGLRETLLRMITSRKRINGGRGLLHITRSRTLRARDVFAAGTPPSHVLRVEQSNTSIQYRDQYFFKLYRKLEQGVNPEVELLRYLSEEQGFAHVPRYAGSIEYESPGGERSALGLLIEYVPSSGDAWSYTRDAIDRFFEVLLVGEEQPEKQVRTPPTLLDVDSTSVPQQFVEMADGFFLEMIELLGKRTGEMHLALAAEERNPAYAPEPFSRLYQRSLYQSLRSLTRRVQGTVRSLNRAFFPDSGTLVQDFLDLEEPIIRRFSRITERLVRAKKIRIHGDYHLGQVLFTGRDFVIIDLEGEPARTLSERRLKFSALRDVAGMLRSFHYAIHSRYLDAVSIRPEDEARLEPWIRTWYTWVGGLFLQSYLHTVSGASFIPADRESLEMLLEVYLLEKAVYEVGYEVSNRPGWVRIPLEGIRFVLAGATGTEEE